FFTRLYVKEAPAKGNGRNFYLGEKTTGEIGYGITSRSKESGTVPAIFVGGQPIVEPPVPADFKEPMDNKVPPAPPRFSRKQQLAELITGDNPYFARAAVNRVWAQFFGRGFVMPVDDLRDENEPSHPQLFQELATQFVAHGYDLKWFIREIANSDV